jgi:hypothetical protein
MTPDPERRKFDHLPSQRRLALIILSGIVLALSGCQGHGAPMTPTDPTTGPAQVADAAPQSDPPTATADPTPTPPSQTLGPPRPTPVSERLTAPAEGAPAPDLTLTDLNGDQVRLSALEGQPVLLNFWATW